MAYQEFLRANGINPEDLSQKEYSDIINTQEMYNDDLIHFSNSENCKEVGGWGREGLLGGWPGRAFLVCGQCPSGSRLCSEYLCVKSVVLLQQRSCRQSVLMTLNLCPLLLLLAKGSAPGVVSGRRVGVG